MHDTAMEFGQAFFSSYLDAAKGMAFLDIGAQDVNGSLRKVAPPENTYTGVDSVQARGVDIVLSDPYQLPFSDETFDAVVSSSCFGHIEFFWLVFNEALRVLKPKGLLYINVPSNGDFHRAVVDCWRFYPDSGLALQRWGNRNGYSVLLLESFIGMRKLDVWNDFVAVFIKDARYVDQYPRRILDLPVNYLNGYRHGASQFDRFSSKNQDQLLQNGMLNILSNVTK